jgi:hypothetical protein
VNHNKKQLVPILVVLVYEQRNIGISLYVFNPFLVFQVYPFSLVI